MRRNLTSFKIIGPLFFLSKEGKKTFFKKKIKSKENAVWGHKPVCKIGINDNKNKVLFLEKKRFCHTLYKKKVWKLDYSWEIHVSRSCLCCVYVQYVNLNQFSGSFIHRFLPWVSHSENHWRHFHRQRMGLREFQRVSTLENGWHVQIPWWSMKYKNWR